MVHSCTVLARLCKGACLCCTAYPALVWEPWAAALPFSILVPLKLNQFYMCRSCACLLAAGLQTLKLLQSLHTSGWLHRDVKPANFVRTRDSDPAAGGEWRILDFGLARQYISKEGLIVDAREGYNEFRGSTNYASIKAHQKEELGAISVPLILLTGHGRIRKTCIRNLVLTSLAMQCKRMPAWVYLAPLPLHFLVCIECRLCWACFDALLVPT